MADVSKPRRNVAANLFLLVGAILIAAGALTAFASVPPADDAIPANYGEAAPPVRPTVTALPAEGQIAPEGQLDPAPQQLPDTPAQLRATPRTPIVRAPTAVPDPAARAPRRIIIPAINLDAPIETVGWHVINGVSTWDVPDRFSAGWLKTSAVLGQPGNTVLDGHHNIAGEVFRRLVDLKLGDEIDVFADGEVFAYKITTRQILKERDAPYEMRVKNAQWIMPTDDERLTLVTCWPYT
ncbi:MAG TPA: sortase, partial [Anaerolineae bacterium]|nr:sortase [Anaerolineae bacterium]